MTRTGLRPSITYSIRNMALDVGAFSSSCIKPSVELLPRVSYSHSTTCLKLHLKLEVSVIKEPQRGAYINGY